MMFVMVFFPLFGIAFTSGDVLVQALSFAPCFRNNVKVASAQSNPTEAGVIRISAHPCYTYEPAIVLNIKRGSTPSFEKFGV